MVHNQREGDAPDNENQRPQIPTGNQGPGRSLTRDKLEVGSPVAFLTVEGISEPLRIKIAPSDRDAGTGA